MRFAKLALAATFALGAGCTSAKPPAEDFAVGMQPDLPPPMVDFATRVDLLPIDYDAGLPSGPNIVPMYVDGFGSFNVGYITMTICAPGTTTCQTIDHVLVDTGSVGLRITHDALNATMLAALPVAQGGGQDLAECYTYASGYVYGSVRTVNLQISGESVSAMPVNILGDLSTTPSDCALTGEQGMNDAMDLGGNAIIGIAPLTPDCGLYCNTTTNELGPIYYGCTAGTCAKTGVADAAQLPNPFAVIANDNNGYIIDMPAISDVVGGVSPTGTITFGIGTQSNNAITTQKIYDANASGGLVVLDAKLGMDSVHNTVFDSGTSILYIEAPGVPDCTGMFEGLFCAEPVTTLSVPLSGRDGASGQYPIKVGNGADLFGNTPDDVTALDDIAADIGTGTNFMIFGLPSFFGHRLYFGMEGKTVNGHLGPFYAF